MASGFDMKTQPVISTGATLNLTDIVFGAAGQSAAAPFVTTITAIVERMALSIPTFTSTLKGLTPASGGGTTLFLRADGTWATPVSSLSDGDKGDITVSGSGTVWTIDAGSVTNAKQADMATARLKGRTTAGTGAPEDLTGTQVTALLDVFTSGAKGLVAASGGGAANLLKADGSWGTVGTTNITDAAVTNAKLANMATATFKGRATAGTGVPEDVTAVQATGILVPGVDTVSTATYTTVAGDNGRVKLLSNASAITLTLRNSAAIGESVMFAQILAGQVTFVVQAGGTLRSAGSRLKTETQYSMVTAVCVANSGGTAAEWYITGGLVV